MGRAAAELPWKEFCPAEGKVVVHERVLAQSLDVGENNQSGCKEMEKKKSRLFTVVNCFCTFNMKLIVEILFPWPLGGYITATWAPLGL